MTKKKIMEQLMKSMSKKQLRAYFNKDRKQPMPRPVCFIDKKYKREKNKIDY